MDDRLYWVLLNMVPGVGPAKFKRLVDAFGDAETAWKASARDLAMAGLERKAIEGLQRLRATVDPAAERRRLDRMGIKVLTLLDDAYPSPLRDISDPPPVLYVMGDLQPSDAWAVAVVGTRRATGYGRQVVDRLVAPLARAGVTIVSGLAKGIDTYAHQAALAAGGRTIAVLGSGLDQVYPPENTRLAAEVARKGALITEFPLGMRPDALNFPRRNRIISGLCMGTLVVEAGHQSGALITADFALEQGREVFAVPGNITSPSSQGTNQLIKDGAKLVTEAQDILEELSMTAVAHYQLAQEVLPDNEVEARLMQFISGEPIHIDELGRRAELPSALVSSTLTMLELKGMVRQVSALSYVRSRL